MQWRIDCYLMDLASGALMNVTAVDRISPCNTGLAYLPGGQKLTFTPLIDGVSKPFMMDLDGHHKQDVSGGTGGFIYGFGASPDGQLISYHEDYQIYIAHRDGSGKRHIATGNPFNFGPTWSPDGQWLVFLSGVHGKSNPYVVRRDGSGLRKLADVNGYQGWVLFLDVDDFHTGSSDVPAWGRDGPWVYFTSKTDTGSTEIMRANIAGKQEQLTHSPPHTLNYQPIPSPDGKWVCFGSNRTGTRQLYVMRSDGKSAYPITSVPPHSGAQWPSWQPLPPFP
jgi:TolB protein